MLCSIDPGTANMLVPIAQATLISAPILLRDQIRSGIRMVRDRHRDGEIEAPSPAMAPMNRPKRTRTGSPTVAPPPTGIRPDEARCAYAVASSVTLHRVSGRPDAGGVRRSAQAAEAAAALRAIGIPDRDITILRGDEGAARLDGTGEANGPIARLRRLVSFTVMDQLPDFAYYEQAVRDGGAVLMVRVRGDRQKRAALDALRAHGGHFINYYGRFATEELERWRGPEPDIPSLHASLIAPERRARTCDILRAITPNHDVRGFHVPTNLRLQQRPPPPTRPRRRSPRPRRPPVTPPRCGGSSPGWRRCPPSRPASSPPRRTRSPAPRMPTWTSATRRPPRSRQALQDERRGRRADRRARDRDGQAAGADRRRDRGLRRDPRVPQPRDRCRSGSTSCARCYAISAASGSISAEENAVVNEIARELDLDPAAVNAVRAAFHDRLSAVQEVRRLAGTD